MAGDTCAYCALTLTVVRGATGTRLSCVCCGEENGTFVPEKWCRHRKQELPGLGA